MSFITLSRRILIWLFYKPGTRITILECSKEAYNYIGQYGIVIGNSEISYYLYVRIINPFHPSNKISHRQISVEPECVRPI